MVRIAGPIGGVAAEADHAVKGRIRPIPDARDVAVPDRVEMDVIGVAPKIGFVAQRVLPITALPDAALAFARPARRDLVVTRQIAAKTRLYELPAGGEISVAHRQSPDRMNVVRQYDDGVDRERMVPSCRAERRAQRFDMIGEQSRPALGQIYMKK